MKAAVLYSDKIKEYDLGHVLTGERFDNFLHLFEEKLGSNPNLELVEPTYATYDDLRLIHTDQYIKRIERLENCAPFDTPLLPAWLGLQSCWLEQEGLPGSWFIQRGLIRHLSSEAVFSMQEGIMKRIWSI